MVTKSLKNKSMSEQTRLTEIIARVSIAKQAAAAAIGTKIIRLDHLALETGQVLRASEIVWDGKSWVKPSATYQRLRLNKVKNIIELSLLGHN